MVYLLLFRTIIRKKIIKSKFNPKKLFFLYILSIPIQMIEGSIWLLLGEFNCGTQLKLTAFITNTLFILLAHYFLTSKKLNIKNKVLILIGDYSFGIYLSHLIIIKLLKIIPIYSTLPYIINSIIVIITSLIFVIIGKKMCGRKISKHFGFY